MGIERSRKRYDDLQRWTEPALFAVTLAFVVVALIRESDALAGSAATLQAAEWGLWAIFPVEFVAMLTLAPDRKRFLRERWWELPIMLLTLPTLAYFLAWLAPARFLRFLRSARAVRAVRLTRVGGVLARYTHGIRMVLTRHGLQYVLLGAIVLYAMSTFLVYLVERGANRPIQTFPEALWWGVTAITTLPNDGNVPATATGKGIAVFVVLLGLTLISLITANIAAFLVRSESTGDSAKLSAIYVKLAQIEGRLGNSSDPDEAAKSTSPPP